MSQAFLAVLLLGGIMFGCRESDPQNVPNSLGIEVKADREDVPRFKRIYTARLDNRATITIKASSFLGRNLSGELTQPDGRWILFDPDKVADKILDPLLVPIVEKYCDEIKRLDKEFMRGNPNSFIDEKGNEWVRK
jgi:hypothetical protein